MKKSKINQLGYFWLYFVEYGFKGRKDKAVFRELPEGLGTPSRTGAGDNGRDVGRGD